LPRPTREQYSEGNSSSPSLFSPPPQFLVSDLPSGGALAGHPCAPRRKPFFPRLVSSYGARRYTQGSILHDGGWNSGWVSRSWLFADRCDKESFFRGASCTYRRHDEHRRSCSCREGSAPRTRGDHPVATYLVYDAKVGSLPESSVKKSGYLWRTSGILA